MNLEGEILEAYFESNGFLVRQTGQINLSSLKKKQQPLPTFAVFNPMTEKNSDALGYRLYTGDLQGVRSALVSLLGWENTAFSKTHLHSDSGLLKFFKNEANEEKIHSGYNPLPSLVESGMGSFLRLLVVPTLPKSDLKLKQSFNFFKEKGVDGILTLCSILENLLKQVVPTDSYAYNRVFHFLKLLKAYDLVREPQLEMFKEE